MPSANPIINKLGAQIGGKSKQDPADPDLADLKRELRAEKALEYIQRLTEDPPTLTERQRARIAAALLLGGRLPDRGAIAA